MSTIDNTAAGSVPYNAAGIAADLAAIAGSTTVSLAADLLMLPENTGTPLPVFGDRDEFYVLVSGDTIRAGVKLNDGSYQRFYVKNDVFADGEAHRIELTMDSESGAFILSVDGRSIFEQAYLDFDLPADFSGTNIGTAPGRPDATANLSNIAITAKEISATVLSSLQNDGTVSLDFEDGETPIGLVLKGDAVIDGSGVLRLDGAGDYAELTERYSLKDAEYLSVSFDFQFADATATNNTKLIWNNDAFGIRVYKDAINLMVTDGKGDQEYIWLNNAGIQDQNWHNISLTIDALNGALTLSVDGEAIVDQTGVSLSLPATARTTTIGSDGWGSSLNGAIDNVVLTTARPQEMTLDPIEEIGEPEEQWDAVGIADPSMALNTTGYIKWEADSTATFIDRMKGAHAWNGKHELLYNDKGSYHVFRDASIFTNPDAVKDVAYSAETLLNLDLLLSISRWNKGTIDAEQHKHILANVPDFFKIETGSSGNSELYGRLYETDEFSLLARFDQDIGTDFETLREQGHIWLHHGRDISVGFNELDLDENGWAKSLPVNIAGGEGSVSTIAMWYPASAAEAPGNI